jgi:hypothetical protein
VRRAKLIDSSKQQVLQDRTVSRRNDVETASTGLFRSSSSSLAKIPSIVVIEAQRPLPHKALSRRGVGSDQLVELLFAVAEPSLGQLALADITTD